MFFFSFWDVNIKMNMVFKSEVSYVSVRDDSLLVARQNRRPVHSGEVRGFSAHESQTSLPTTGSGV